VKIFVYEHVTGGGMAGVPLPPGLLHEADLMVRTLLADLSTCAGVELLTSRDSRLPVIAGIPTLEVGPADAPFRHVLHGIEASDAVWPTAPETDGVLERLATAAINSGRILLGSRPEAVRVASSKLATVRALRAAGVPAVSTFAIAAEIPPGPGRWVTKPDDGAGAEGARVEPTWRHARERLATPGLIAQPWVEGGPLSLSLLCADGQGVLLACNRQRVQIAGDRVVLSGIEVNAITDDSGELARLGDRIAGAIPGLWGYVGVDLIMTVRGAVVLEVNPRLTTSYCGLGTARGFSLAAKVLELLEPGALARWRPPTHGSTVDLTLEASRGH